MSRSIGVTLNITLCANIKTIEDHPVCTQPFILWKSAKGIFPDIISLGFMDLSLSKSAKTYVKGAKSGKITFLHLATEVNFSKLTIFWA